MTGWDVPRACSIGEMGWIAGCLLPRVLGEGALSWGYEGVECAKAIGKRGVMICHVARVLRNDVVLAGRCAQHRPRASPGGESVDMGRAHQHMHGW